MVTKEDVDKAKAAFDAAAKDSEAFLLNGQLLDGAEAAWDNYIELKEAFFERLVMLHYDALPILIQFVIKCQSSSDENVREAAYDTLSRWDYARCPKSSTHT